MSAPLKMISVRIYQPLLSVLRDFLKFVLFMNDADIIGGGDGHDGKIMKPWKQKTVILSTMSNKFLSRWSKNSKLKCYGRQTLR